MRKLIVAVLLVAAPMVAAHGEEFRGFYVGLGVGQSSVDADKSRIDQSVISAFESAGATVLDGHSELSDSDITFDVTVGYQLFRYLAFEAAYMDLGTARYTADGTVDVGFIAPSHVDIDADARGFALSGLAMLPLGDWHLFARLGGFYSMVDTSASLKIDTESFSDRRSDKSTEFLWGAGFGYTAGAITTRVEYQTVTDVGTSSALGEADVRRLLLGVTYRFGQ